MKLITKIEQADGQKPIKKYYINSKSDKNKLHTSTRLNQWDSEEKTLKGWINEGLTVDEIKRFSKDVTINEKQMIKILSENDDKQSIAKIQLVYNETIIQTNRMGRFSDKFLAKRFVYDEAMKIKEGKKTITHQDGSEIKIKQEFFDGKYVIPQLIYKSGMDYDCIVEKDTLNPYIYLAANEILDIASDLKKGKTISDVIEDMFYSPYCYYVFRELTEEQLILFEKEYFSKRLNPIIEYICRVSNESPEGMVIFQNNSRVKNRNPKDYVWDGDEK